MKSKIMILVSLIILATMVGCEKLDKDETREVSSTFTLPVNSADGTEGEYVLIGEEGKVGFLIGSGKRGQATTMPIIANQANKYMWYFWGEVGAVTGDFKVVGIDEEGKEHPVLVVGNDTVWEYANGSISPHNGADNHIPSSMVFPTSGLWKLDIYFDEKLFGEIVINVEDR